MANRVICHYGVKGMKWSKVKSVEPDDRKGMDDPTEGMDDVEKRIYNFIQSPFHRPNEYPDYVDKEFNEKQIPSSKNKSVEIKKIRPPRVYGSSFNKPRKDHDTNIPIKNRLSPESKKKVEEFVEGLFKNPFNKSKEGSNR